MCSPDLSSTQSLQRWEKTQVLNPLLTDNAWDQELRIPRKLSPVGLDHYMGNFSRCLDRVTAKS